MVSLTDAGREIVQQIDTINDPEPNVLGELDDAELNQLRSILTKLAR
jgi:hypothetical protein